MRKFGYARVSTSKQSLSIQIEQLKEAGVEKHRILTDKATGKNLDRKGLQELIIKVEKGDSVSVTSLDRLGRDNSDMTAIINEFSELGVIVSFLKEGIDTSGEIGKMIIFILSAVAQAERARILERTNEGRIAAQASGKVFGRKRTIDRQKIKQMHKEGNGATKIANELSISRTSVYKILNEK